VIGYQIIADVQRIAHLEAQSARPNAPVIPEPETVVRAPRIASLRLQMTFVLRRLADVLEPAPMETVPTQTSSPC
jgi:hypothetical protein